MNLNISNVKMAKENQLLEIMSLLKNCTATLRDKGIFQWGEHYPVLEDILKDIKNKEVFFIENQGKKLVDKSLLAAVVTLNTFQDAEYATINWLNKEAEKALVVHRLAVEPQFWGEGWGRVMMDFAEDFAQKKGYHSIRFDVFSGNTAATHFYEKRGYQRVGTINLSSCGAIEAFCYEKMIHKN